MEKAQGISHAIYDWAADMIPALWTGVVLSPLKRCCHNAFIFHPPPSPAGEREHACHLMVRMYNGDTAGPCAVGEGEETVLAYVQECVRIVQKCVNVWSRVCVCAYLSHHVAMHHAGVR